MKMEGLFALEKWFKFGFILLITPPKFKVAWFLVLYYILSLRTHLLEIKVQMCWTALIKITYKK